MYPGDSPPAIGVEWQWAGDSPGEWFAYNMEVQCILEDARNSRARQVDLSLAPSSLPYVVRAPVIGLQLSNMSFMLPLVVEEGADAPA